MWRLFHIIMIYGLLIEKISIGIYDTKNQVICGGGGNFLIVFLSFFPQNAMNMNGL